MTALSNGLKLSSFGTTKKDTEPYIGPRSFRRTIEIKYDSLGEIMRLMKFYHLSLLIKLLWFMRSQVRARLLYSMLKLFLH